jgi:hypothetical protein
MAAAGSGGHGERRPRATRSCPHLGLGRLVERDRRRRAVCNRGDLGWRRWELGGERAKCLGGAGRGGERRCTIYKRGKAVSRPGRAHGARACLLMAVRAARPAGFATGVDATRRRCCWSVGQAGSDAMESEPGVPEGARWPAACGIDALVAGDGMLARPCAWNA